MNDLTVQISGKAGSGKTTLAVAIKRLVEAYGVTCDITGDDSLTDPVGLPYPLYLRAMAGKTRIVITTRQVNGVFACHPVPPNPFGVFACHSVDGPIEPESLRNILNLNGPIADVQPALEEDLKKPLDLTTP